MDINATLDEQLQWQPEERDERSVLIVDDEHAIADVLAHHLRRQGYRTTVATNGRDAIDVAHRESPDLVLLDIRLPDIDGFTVCRQLDESPETCGIPVVFLSGMDRPDVVRQSRAAGGAYFMHKPYDPNALLIVIEHAISEASEF